MPRRLAGLAVLAAGAVAGVALEELLYRRSARGRDTELEEPIGSVPGRTTWIESFDGTKLYTRVYGSQDPQLTLVFLHGIVESHVLWHYQVRDLRTDGRLRLVTYDSRGHGESGPATGPDGTTAVSGTTLARDLEAVIQATCPGPIVPVGHSMGGMSALAFLGEEEFAAARQCVAGAVIVNSTFTGQLAGWRDKGPRWQRTFERGGDIVRRVAGDDARRIDTLRPRMSDLAMVGTRWLAYGDRPSARHVAVSFQMFDRTPAQTLAAGIDLNRFDACASLPKIDVPVLVIGGSRDLITPVWLSEEMHRRIPDSELVVFDGCGHLAPFERHGEVTAHLQKFIDRLIG